MAKALEELRACPVKVPEGLDDRNAVLHAARFLDGPTCSLQHQWLLAREIHGLDGVTPLSGYDTDALGISGCVTSRGWHGSPPAPLAVLLLPTLKRKTSPRLRATAGSATAAAVEPLMKYFH
jgi:hypothetical protein